MILNGNPGSMTTSSEQALNSQESGITLNPIRRNGIAGNEIAEIRRQAEIAFPLAKQFIRPGFDD